MMVKRFSSMTIQEVAERASDAQTDISLFASITKLCEGSEFSPDCQGTTFPIVRLCKAGQTRALVRYDRAMDEMKQREPD